MCYNGCVEFGGVCMQKKDAAALDAIMKHKEYFDQRLIDMVTDLNRTIKIRKENALEKLEEIFSN